MARDVTIYVPRSDLEVKGTTVKKVLNELVREGLISSYTEMLQLHFTKDQCIHIQAVLEFHGIKTTVISSPKQTRKDKD